MLVDKFKVNSPSVHEDKASITSEYLYDNVELDMGPGGVLEATPVRRRYTFKTSKRVPKLGMMLVGWGGNNGSTLTGGLIANREGITWETKDGKLAPNWWGSVTQASTCRLGSYNEEEVYCPFNKLVPMVDPNDLVVGGWDISGTNLADAMARAKGSTSICSASCGRTWRLWCRCRRSTRTTSLLRTRAAVRTTS